VKHLKLFEETDNRYYQKTNHYEYRLNVAVGKFDDRSPGKGKPIVILSGSEIKRLTDLMENNPNVSSFRYNKFVDREYGWIDYFTIYLKKQGDETFEIV